MWSPILYIKVQNRWGAKELGYNDIYAWECYSTRGCTILVKAMQSLHVKRN